MNMTHPIMIILVTFLFLPPFHYFRQNEISIGREFSLTAMQKKNSKTRRFLTWAFTSKMWPFSKKRNQMRIYYYARLITKIALILAAVTLALMFGFKWHLNPSFVWTYECILVIFFLAIQLFPLVLYEIHNHIVRKEKRKAQKQSACAK